LPVAGGAASGEGFRVVDAFSRIVRLGEGVSSSRRLSEAAISRAMAASGHLP
jgi:exopolyphosphatase/guanosine-5'-triphosphate,3'-diphosphate pyrophosphatase